METCSEFWDAFDASIHKTNYAPIDKFSYLKSKLEGEALEAISGYQLSNENYTVVIDLPNKTSTIQMQLKI